MIQQLPITTVGSIERPSLLLLHGFMGCSQDWGKLLPVLTEHFYCVTIDLPGHGRAANIDWSFVETVDYLISLQKEVSPSSPSHLWGYSMGGRLALAAALQSPLSWQRVVLESASPGLKDESAREQRRESDRGIARKLQRSDLDFAAFLNHWYAQDIFAGLMNAPRLTQMLQRRLDGDPISYSRALERLGLSQQPYLGERLAQYDQPLLVMAGALDKKFVAISQDMAALCPAIQLEVVADCGHNIHDQGSDRWLTLVQDWLQDHPKSDK